LLLLDEGARDLVLVPTVLVLAEAVIQSDLVRKDLDGLIPGLHRNIWRLVLLIECPYLLLGSTEGPLVFGDLSLWPLKKVQTGLQIALLLHWLYSFQ